MKRYFKLMYEGSGRNKVSLKYEYIGEDLLIIITGGEQHIGGMSLATKDSLQTIKKKNHKDHQLSNKVAKLIHEKTTKDTLVICGIHIKNATKEDINLIIKNTDKCINKLLKELK